MKDLRERCEKVYYAIRNDDDPFSHEDLESFALQIRNEALEEAKEAVSKPMPGVTSDHAVTLMLACDRITALAAGGPEEKA